MLLHVVYRRVFAASDDDWILYLWARRRGDYRDNTSGMRFFFSVIADYCIREGRCWVAVDVGDPVERIVGAALWQPPLNDAGVSLWGMCRSGLLAAPFRMGLSACARLGSALSATEEAHAAVMGERRHWSLYSIAFLRDYRERGLGTRLMAPILRAAQAESVPVYLDTASKRSFAFFDRQDFALVTSSQVGRLPRFYSFVLEPKQKQYSAVE
eukprot:TRINITY_DN7653_c0_g1_i1.p1 TRINITY_DN7653_c0_g1~~TRINITY_DN7653_c0_g1_i1.p1  ORF type:complete len:212 (+),score=55.81 TRINITY_DN7653_c0_g1_i1:553-1188(+)